MYRRTASPFFREKIIKGRKVSTMKAKLCFNVSVVDWLDVECKIIQQAVVGGISCMGREMKKSSHPRSQCSLDT